MGVQMFTTARYMETWAHSQEVYDLVGVERSYTDRIKNIADTKLAVSGPVATQWMSIAQCFAGGAVDPPKPGTRKPQS